MNNFNELLLQIAKRAERKSDEYLVRSFVPLGHIFTILKIEENQVIYGRRGTGKTHLLKYLKKTLELKNEIVIEADMRCLGSTSGIYSDANIPLSERSTRLLSDLLCEIHTSLIEQITANDICDLSKVANSLDELLELATNISIDGTIAIEQIDGQASEQNKQLNVNLSTTPSAKIAANKQEKQTHTLSNKSTSTGREKLKLHFGAITKEIQKITTFLPNKKLWILLDEWSEVPIDLQPYLAESIKKILFAIPNLTIKIASIEHRSKFRKSSSTGFIGLELSSDASTSCSAFSYIASSKTNWRICEVSSGVAGLIEIAWPILFSFQNHEKMSLIRLIFFSVTCVYNTYCLSVRYPVRCFSKR